MKRVLVTGAGIIGSHIARLLVEQGREVVLLDLAPEARHIASIVDPGALSIVQGDVTDAAMLRALAERHRIEGVIHTAAMLTKASQQQPARAVDVNIGGAVNIMELVRHGLVRRAILASSTSFQYPAFNAPRSGSIPEDFRIDIVGQAPRSIYSATKLAMEFLASNYVDLYGADVGVVRYAAVLGAWSGPNVGIVSRLVQSLFEAARRDEAAVIDDQSQVWDGIEEFVDARDCAAGSLAALDAPALTSRIYHLTSPTGHTFEQFIETARGLYPKLRVEQHVRPRGGLANFPWPRTALSDISAARRDLGYEPAYSLRQSLEYFAALVGD